MAVRIRLRRVGRKKQPSYRVVVADRSAARDGAYIETIGFYNPRRDPAELRLDLDRVDYWMGNGAEPSTTVHSLILKARKGGDSTVGYMTAEQIAAEAAAPKAQAPKARKAKKAEPTEETEAKAEPAEAPKAKAGSRGRGKAAEAVASGDAGEAAKPVEGTEAAEAVAEGEAEAEEQA